MKISKNAATNTPPATKTAVVTGLFGSFSGDAGAPVAGWVVGAGTGSVLSSVGCDACVPSGSEGTEAAGCVGCAEGVVFSVAVVDSVGCVETGGSVSNGSLTAGCVVTGGSTGSEGSVTTGGIVDSVGSVGCVGCVGSVLPL
jgi:hypothetical protein